MRFLLAALLLVSTACGGNARLEDGGLDAATTERDAGDAYVEVDGAQAEDAAVDHVCIPLLADAYVEDAASTDAWTTSDAWGPDTGDYCPGLPRGAYECSGGSGRECCGGRWRHFSDGPCAPRRADSGTGTGPSACVSVPYSDGCPCSEEGAESCDWYHRIRCVCGTWREMHGIGCCGP